MTAETLTKTRLRAGVWQGILSTGKDAPAPEIDVWHLEAPLQGVSVKPVADQPGQYLVAVPIPITALNDGVQTFVIQNKHSQETYASFTIIAGDPLDDDLRAEINLLRAELDLLKRAFRRHCVETA
ncbi:MAG: hypothetical protein ACK4SS_02755 [Cypionkella sp.]